MKRAVQLLMVLVVLAGGALLLTNLQTSLQGTNALAQAGQADAGCKSGAPVKDFFVMTGEWEQDKGIATDRGFTPEKEEGKTVVERYTFDPGAITVRVGDCVRLFIHDIKGSHHNLTIQDTGVDSVGSLIIDDAGKETGVAAVARANPNAAVEDPKQLKDGEFARGEQIRLEFTATQAGLLKLLCEVHTFVDEKTGALRGYDSTKNNEPTNGPMVLYITVVP